MKTMIVGSGGREAALSWRMAQNSQLHAFMSHMNPSIISDADHSGGRWTVGDILDPEAVADYAVQQGIELAVVSADAPLEAGVVDALRARGIKTVGPDRLGAQIEWDKKYSRHIIAKYCPDFNPEFYVARSYGEAVAFIDGKFADRDFAIKPQGLTGGQGVKVTGVNIGRGDEAKEYIRQLLSGGHGSVILEESLHSGVEFSLQVLTDGKGFIAAPATQDHPYREDGDLGPNTGGMGVISDASDPLPFMTEEQYRTCVEISRKIIDGLRAEGRHFNGVLSGGFFLMPDGSIKIIEFNARFGDPECLNIMALLEDDCNLVAALEKMADGTLEPGDIRFKPDTASALVYMVPPEYAYSHADVSHAFTVPTRAIEAAGCRVFFAAAVEGERPGEYITHGPSRSLAIVGTGRSYEQAAQSARHAAGLVTGPLVYRRDIGDPHYVRALQRRVGLG